jgi:DNA integrity scanning protein DisA with diadenylate cyclase activity
MAAGVHLDAALEREGHMPGLGCRHMAAAGITDVTDAVAITISGSTGTVRIFRKGAVIFELERPV